METDPALPAPARYFPAASGKYEVSAGLRPLGTSYGNTGADGLAFQLDSQFGEYRENKLRCRAERLEKYCRACGYDEELARAVARFFAVQLPREHPDFFSLEEDREGTTLHCRLTGETLRFDGRMRLRACEGGPEPLYRDALDALCSQVQEDAAVVRREPDGRDRLAAFHICAPSHWSPEEKLGRDFVAIHAPVPGIERVSRAAPTLVDAMVRKGPLVRFVWGIDTDPRLNRHTDCPEGMAPEAWRSPTFDPRSPSPFTFRVERQVMWGLPEADASIFLIRLYRTPAAELSPQERERLAAALRGMSPESRVYKGVAPHIDGLLRWLES